MLDVQSLMNEIQRLSESVAWWNKWVIGGMAATAVAASFLVIAQLMVNTERRFNSPVHNAQPRLASA